MRSHAKPLGVVLGSIWLALAMVLNRRIVFLLKALVAFAAARTKTKSSIKDRVEEIEVGVSTSKFAPRKHLFLCEQKVYDFEDKHGVGKSLFEAGVAKVRFFLPDVYNTTAKRIDSPDWYDQYHPRAAVVATYIVAPMVRQVLASCNYTAGTQFSIAIVGDSTTAWCCERGPVETRSTRWDLADLIAEELDNNLVTVFLYSITGTGFQNNGIIGQLENVKWLESRHDLNFSAVLVIGGWNSVPEDARPNGITKILNSFDAWIEHRKDFA